MGPAKKKAVLKHHSEQPFFNIVVGLAPPDYHSCRTLPGQVNQLELKHFEHPRNSFVILYSQKSPWLADSEIHFLSGTSRSFNV